MKNLLWSCAAVMTLFATGRRLFACFTFCLDSNTTGLLVIFRDTLKCVYPVLGKTENIYKYKYLDQVIYFFTASNQQSRILFSVFDGSDFITSKRFYSTVKKFYTAVFPNCY